MASSARVLTSAARKPRCLNRLRASRVAALQAAVPGQLWLYGKPTTINNTQRLASVPQLCEMERHGLQAWRLRTAAARSCSRCRVMSKNRATSSCRLGIPVQGAVVEDWVASGKAVKLKAVIPGGSSCQVVPADVIMAARWITDRCNRRGPSWHRCGDGHGRDHVHGAECCAESRASIMAEAADSARRVAKARAGCIGC